ncbi:required for drug-induced death protein 1-like [Lycodopsis pacificus]
MNTRRSEEKGEMRNIEMGAQEEENQKEEEEEAVPPAEKKKKQQKNSKEVFFSVLPDRYEPLIEEVEEEETPEERTRRKEEKKRKRRKKFKKYRKNAGKALRFSCRCLMLGLQNMAALYSTPASAVSVVVTEVHRTAGSKA